MVFAATLAFAKRRPLTFAIGFGGVKTIAADAFVQKYMEHADAYDQKRLLVFLTFGFFQVGFVQYNVYVNLFSRLFPAGASFTAAPIAAKLADGQGLRNLAKQVFIDQCVYHPCCYFPVFYICKEIINAEPQPPLTTVRNALTAYAPNATEDLKALWSIFVPVSIVQMSFVPMHLRVPFNASVGFIWCMILSAMRGKDARGGDLVTAEQREGAALARSTSTQPGVREGRQGRVLLRRRSTNALGIPWKEGRGE